MNAPLLPAMREQTRVAFVNDRRRFAGLVTRGAILQIVTFGFYRFWLATDIRRHLWSHSAPGGDPLEYLGTAKDLLIGFLIGLAILAPVYFLYFLASLAAETVQAFASVPFFLFLVVFRDFARYHGQRYRLRRTVWRGLAFSMDGSGWSYALRSALWGLLVIVTFGLALPWRLAALERYKMGHVSYGDVRASFDATGGGLFRAGWTLWLWVVVYVASLGAAGNFGRGFAPGNLGMQILLFLVAFIATLLMPIVLAAYKARIWRWWASGVSFGGARLSSDLDGESFVMIYLQDGTDVPRPHLRRRRGRGSALFRARRRRRHFYTRRGRRFAPADAASRGLLHASRRRRRHCGAHLLDARHVARRCRVSRDCESRSSPLPRRRDAGRQRARRRIVRWLRSRRLTPQQAFISTARPAAAERSRWRSKCAISSCAKTIVRLRAGRGATCAAFMRRAG